MAAYLLVVLAALGRAAWGQTGERLDPKRAAVVKAGMVVNFIRYTAWPAGSFADTPQGRAPLVVTLVGDNDVDDALVAAADGLSIGGRSIEVRRARYPVPRRGEAAVRAEDVEAFHRAVRGSHVAYFGSSEAGRYTQTLGALAGTDVLTVSDIDGFAENGGMLALTIRDKRVAFDANEDAIKATALKVSSKLLRLARIVRSAVTPAAREGGGRGGAEGGGR